MRAWHIQRKPEKTGGTGDGLGGVRGEIGGQGLSQQQALKSKAQRNHDMV